MSRKKLCTFWKVSRHGIQLARINWLNDHLFEELKVLILRVREVYGI